MGVTMLNQSVTGIGTECGDTNCCIPTSILYNKVSWSIPQPITCDTFDRTVASSWGTVMTGVPWTITGDPNVGSIAFSVNGSQGVMTPSSTAVDGFALVGGLNQYLMYDATTSFAVSGAGTTADVSFVSYWTSANNYYRQRASFDYSAKTVTVQFSRRVAGSTTSIHSEVIGIEAEIGQVIHLRVQARGGASSTRRRGWTDMTSRTGNCGMWTATYPAVTSACP
jgi:hypothetical protein